MNIDFLNMLVSRVSNLAFEQLNHKNLTGLVKQTNPNSFVKNLRS